MADDKTVESPSENIKELSVDLLPEKLKIDDIRIYNNSTTEQNAITFLENEHNDKGDCDLNDESDNCPNFSIYSATSIDFTKTVCAESNETAFERCSSDPDPSEECDENLVQMTDDENDDDTQKRETNDEVETKGGVEADHESDESDHENDESDHENDTNVQESDESSHENDEKAQEFNDRSHDNDESAHENVESLLENDEATNENEKSANENDGSANENDGSADENNDSVDENDENARENVVIDENNYENAKQYDKNRENTDEIVTNVKNADENIENINDVIKNVDESSEIINENAIEADLNVDENVKNYGTTKVNCEIDDLDKRAADAMNHDTSNCDRNLESPSKKVDNSNKGNKKVTAPLIPNRKVFLELYDDSDWEEWTNEKVDDEKRINNTKSSSEMDKLTESISDIDDDRGYTPCQDERSKMANMSDNIRKSNSSLGIGGLDTEMVSEEEGNIFTDDLLKLNIARNVEATVEDGEIVEKTKGQASVNDMNDLIDSATLDESLMTVTKNKEKGSESKKSNSTSEIFKKVTSKDRNYRDKDKKKKSRSKSREKRNHRKKKDYSNRKKEKRKDLEYYDVRNVISERNRIRGDKDEYGRERRPMRSRSNSRSRVSPDKTRRKTNSHREKRSRGRSRVRSGYRRFHSSRSKSRSVSRSRSSSVEHRRRNKKSRSIRRRSRSPESAFVSRSVHRSRSRSLLKKSTNSKRKRSPSYRHDWSPPWRPSPSPNSRVSVSPHNNKATSPSWTPPLRDNMAGAKNLKVIVNNKDATKKKKDKKKKSDMRQKETSDRITKKRRRSSLDQPSKEVFASGDNILVSVSFNKNKSTNIDSGPQTQDHNFSKRKSKATDDSRKNKTKTRDKTDKRSKRRRLDLVNRKPIAIIDLDKSPFKELTPSPRAVIVLTDSDDDEKEQSLLTRQERIHKELGSLREESQTGSPSYETLSSFANTGPKTPPEPQASFSLQLKAPPKLRNLNILYDIEEDMTEDNNLEQNHCDAADNNHVEDVLHIGPNTPPEPPNSPPSSPDAYDPFEPTKSPSQSPDIIKSQNNQCLSEKQTNEEKVTENQCHKDIAQINTATIEDNQTDNANTVEKVLAMLTQRYTSPEKGLCSMGQNDIGKSPSDVEVVMQNSAADTKLTSPENAKTGVTILSNVLLQPNMLNMLKTSTPDSMLVYSTGGAPASANPLLTLNTSRSSLFNSAGSVVQNSASNNKTNKSQVRPSPIKSNPIKPMVKTAVIKPGIRQYNANKIHKPLKYDGDVDVDSPYSPCSDDFDDLFEPPTTDAAKTTKTHKTKSPVKKSQDFDHLFSSPSYKPSIVTKADKKLYNKKYKKSKSNKTQVGVKIDDDQLKILDELPSSAVEMQVKDKFMKKLNRQERVVEEVKVVLKPHYAKRHVTKEQYKDILRRAVPKICHNRSGEINPQRIHRLIEAYVKRARYSKKTANTQ